MRRLALPIALLLFGLLAGCAGKDIRSFQGNRLEARPLEFFSGHVTGHGFSETRFGAIRNWFQIDFRGTKNGDTYVWHETLTFQDGRVEKRVWKILPQGKHRYHVTATGMEGDGIGITYGNAVRWNYYLNQTISGNEWTFWVDDWMYRRDENTMIVRATFSWFGITVGRGYMFLRKIDESERRKNKNVNTKRD